tara:strand:+ start:213 stop:695 length:483 start_codon:yes stop_codon:yes gene_type:complete
MGKKILSLYLISFLVCPTVAFAEEPEAETPPEETYDVVTIKAGEAAPFDGVLLSVEAAAKIAVEKKFEDAECDLRISYELHLQSERFQLQLDFKDIEIHSWKDKYESMMILKVAENDRLEKLILNQNPTKEPWLVALGFGIGTLTSLGIFALSTEIVKSE